MSGNCACCNGETDLLHLYYCADCGKRVCPDCARKNGGLCPTCFSPLDRIN